MDEDYQLHLISAICPFVILASLCSSQRCYYLFCVERHFMKLCQRHCRLYPIPFSLLDAN